MSKTFIRKTAITIITVLAGLYCHSSEKDSSSTYLDKINIYKNRLAGTLEVAGFSVESVYKGEIWNFPQTYHPGKITYVDNFDIIMGLDLEQAIGWDGARLSLYILGNNNRLQENTIGSSHGISNISAPPAWGIYTAALDQSFLENKFSLLVGLYDFNSEFDVKETGSIFTNPSHGIGTEIAQSGQNGPSIFPYASFGFRLKLLPNDNFYLLGAFLDGVPGSQGDPPGHSVLLNYNDGFFIASEFGYLKQDDVSYSFKAGSGAWYYTKDYGHIISEIDSWGCYGFIDKSLYRETGSGQGLSAYARLGFADIKSGDIVYFFSGALSYLGLIPGRGNDRTGIAFASGYKAARKGCADMEGCFENNYELTYKMEVADGIFIQPDIQYITCKQLIGRHDHLAIGLRMAMKII